MRGAALLCTLAGVACMAPPPASLQGPTRPLGPDDYPDVLATWTRSDRVYQGLDNKLFVTATYHAPAFRRAFAGAFPDIYGHGGTITRRELVDLSGDVEQYNNFFLSVYTPETAWNDLAQDASIWRLTLHGAGEVAVGPKEVMPIKIDENLRAVYPYIGRFDKCYLVRFPLADALRRIVIDRSSTSFTLRIASALGVAEMTWGLLPPPVEEGSAPPVVPPSSPAPPPPSQPSAAPGGGGS